ncbi:MAG TPA: PQQ-binding-like beta-propeller repeat protein, partial [Planctomycetota bacterium]|nr:PQQ-binding-like beta-propeller repeat protein [Planctomycetota bacterium]
MHGIPLAALLLLCSPAQDSLPVAAPGHWPQWRGPMRDGVSTETGLLREWPKEGPRLLWKATGLGEGTGCLSVAGGLIFMQGNREGKDFVTALDGRGKIVWSVPVGPASGEHPAMRYVTQRSPTVDDGRLYATTWSGMINGMESTTGRILWRKGMKEDLGGSSSGWGYGDAPIVEGNLLICAPGGTKGTLAALNRDNGAVVWQSSELKDRINATPVPAEIGGVRQIVVFTYDHVAGVSPKNGKVLWQVDRPGRTAVVTPPVVHDGIVLVSSGFGQGCNGFQVTAQDGRFTAKEIYAERKLENQHGGMVRIGDHVYATNSRSLLCVELKSGAIVWENRSVGKGSVIAADGLLFVRNFYPGNEIALVEATPEGYRERGRFVQPDRSKEPAFTYLVVAGGRMYVRDHDLLLCYDVRGPDYKAPASPWNLMGPPGKGAKGPSLPPAPGKAPDAAYVPTPQDVVEKMLELAKVGKDDVVCDLGSGDGRVPITASKKYGCASLGYEIEPELLKRSREKAKEAKVDSLVTWMDQDLFTADLSRATVVTLYLGASNNGRLLPKLRELK